VPRIQPREQRARRARKCDADARLQDAVPFGDAAQVRVEVGAIQRVRDDADQLPGRVQGKPGIAVQGDDETDVGDGNFSPDARDINIGTLRLRSERIGGGNGRVYLIVVKVTDAVGNTSFVSTTVVVPKSNSKADVASINNQAAAALAYALSHNGAPPAGYFVIGDGPVIGPKQ